MIKKYLDFMNEITADELYERLMVYGMFAEKIPPIWDTSHFFNFCKQPTYISLKPQKPPITTPPSPSDRNKYKPVWYSYISYNSIREINIPRNIGIPCPMAHEELCSCLRDYWDKLKSHFINTTSNQKYIVSRIHIRKRDSLYTPPNNPDNPYNDTIIRNKLALFKMISNNWKDEGNPENDLIIGAAYVVKADISQCFSSIYSHSISWALIGKDQAKKNIKINDYYNYLDNAVHSEKNGETHGLLIGPHTSSIISELILCKIDQRLTPKWKYIRNIDDYTCYVKTREEADMFLFELSEELRNYDLSLNYKKTTITELPLGINQSWTNILNSYPPFGFDISSRPYVNYRQAESFLDLCLQLMKENNDKASILLYGLIMLKKAKTSISAPKYIIQRIRAYSLLLPYLIPHIDDLLIKAYKLPKQEIGIIINEIYDTYINTSYYEAIAYSIYLAINYDVTINSYDIDHIIKTKDCIVMMISLLYCKKNRLSSFEIKLHDEAISIRDNDEFDEYWLFEYECLDLTEITTYSRTKKNQIWKELKSANISFLKKEYIF